MSKQYYLNNINLFLSKEEFEESKDSLNINDLSLIPIDEGYSAGIPLGFEYLSMNPNTPAGYLPLTGGIYSRTAYKDLWKWIQDQKDYLITESDWQTKAENDSNVLFYSDGDGVTTFRVPNLSHRSEGIWLVRAFGTITNSGKQDLSDISDAFSKVVTIKIWDD